MHKTGYRSFPGRPISNEEACVVRLTLTYDLSPCSRSWSFRRTFVLWPWNKSIGQWGPWLGIIPIFMPPKCRKRATGHVSRTPISNEDCVVRVWPLLLTFLPGHEFGLFATALNFDLELNYWIMGFMTRHELYFQSAKMQKTAYRSFQVSRTTISNEEACVVRVWPWPLTFHPGNEIGLFPWPLKFDLVLNYWIMGFMTRHKLYFQATKMQKTGYRSFHETAKVRLQDAHFKWGGLCRSRYTLTLTFHPGHEFCLFAWPLSFDLELKLLDSGVHDSA